MPNRRTVMFVPVKLHAWNIDMPAHRRVTCFRHKEQRQHYPHCTDWQVDEEDPAPVKGLDQKATDAPRGSLRCCYLSGVLLEVARQILAQVQDRFVSCS